METITASRFKAACLRLLKNVKKTGQPILVTLRGQPIAKVVPPDTPGRETKWLGSAQGTGRIVGDIISPVSGDDWEVLRIPSPKKRG